MLSRRALKILEPQNVKRRSKKCNLVGKFGRLGDRFAFVFSKIWKSKKIYQFNRIWELFCVQVLAILQVDQHSIEKGVIKPILTDTKLLMEYYPDKMVRDIDFLDERDELICLVFDDEILSVKMSGEGLSELFRIKICSFCVDSSVYWGLYKGSYVFGRDTSRTGKMCMIFSEPIL